MKTHFILLLLITGFGIANGQTGPAGVGMNDGSSALKLWLDADMEVFKDTFSNETASAGNRVMFWKDLSGSGNDVRAYSDSTQPTLTSANPLLNGKSALRFFRKGDKTNKHSYLASKSFSSTNDITIYCVFHPLSRAGGNNITPYKSKTYNNNMWYFGSGLVDAGASGFVNDVSLAFCDTSIAAGAGDSSTSTDYCVKTPVSLHKTYLAALQKEAWTGRLGIAQNGGIPNEYLGGAQPINNAPRYFIGANANVSTPLDSPFFDGYIANVLIYNRLLNGAEKVILENYLSAKYGFALQNNDIYTFDDSVSGNFDFEVVGIGKANDGSFQSSAKGEGLIELSRSSELDKGNYSFIGHNGKSLQLVTEDVPEGARNRVERTWIYSSNVQGKKVDLLVDAAVIPSVAKEDLVLLVDTDNNGRLNDETFGKGIFPVSEVTNHGRFTFRGVSLGHGNKFTFAQLKHACQDCEAYFSPNGDGMTDVYYLDQLGKTSIYDRSGTLVKSMSTPGFWDGTNDKGQQAIPGLYFLIANEDSQKTVTLIR